MESFDAQGSKFNVLENMIYHGNVPKLSPSWSFSTIGRYPGSCPIVANGLAYMGSSDGYLYALYAYTGAKVWSVALGSRYTAASCPAIANHILYVGTNGGSLLALNAKTGATLWSVNTLTEVESSPVVMNGAVYVGSWDGHLYAFNAATGTHLWSFATSGPVGSPAVGNGIVYTSSDDGVSLRKLSPAAK